jgi:hypothetical protein
MKISLYNKYHREKDNDWVHIDEQLNANKLWQEMRLELIKAIEIRDDIGI